MIRTEVWRVGARNGSGRHRTVAARVPDRHLAV